LSSPLPCRLKGEGQGEGSSAARHRSPDRAAQLDFSSPPKSRPPHPSFNEFSETSLNFATCDNPKQNHTEIPSARRTGHIDQPAPRRDETQREVSDRYGRWIPPLTNNYG